MSHMNETEALQCLLGEVPKCDAPANDDDPPEFWVAFIIAGVSLLFSASLQWLHYYHRKVNKNTVQVLKEKEWYKNTMVWKGVGFQFCLNLVILGVLQIGDKEMHYKYTGIGSLVGILIICSAIVLYKFVDLNNKMPEAENEEIRKRLEANDTFQDLAKSFSRAFLVFVGEGALLCMYIWALFDQGLPPLDNNRRSYAFYWMGSILQAANVAGKDRFIVKEAVRFAKAWRKIFAFTNAKSCEKESDNTSGGERKRTSVNVSERGERSTKEIHKLSKFPCDSHIRFVMSFLVNVVGYWVIIIGLPVQLSSSGDPYDFVLNAVAAYFIIEIDDYDSPIVYEKLKPKSDEFVLSEREEQKTDKVKKVEPTEAAEESENPVDV